MSSSKELDPDTFIRHLAEARFEEIFEDREELERFNIFLRNRAIPSKGYVVSVPLEEGRLFWLLFRIKVTRRELLMFAAGGLLAISCNDRKKALQEVPERETPVVLEESLEAGPPLKICLEWPVYGPISSYFGPAHPLGIDIDKYNGPDDPVESAAGGRVIYAGGDECCSYGLYVAVDHGQGIFTLYAHLGEIAVKVGEEVAIGQKLGIIGTSGYSAGPHLHFELRKLKEPRLESKVKSDFAKNGFGDRELRKYFYFYDPLKYLDNCTND